MVVRGGKKLGGNTGCRAAGMYITTGKKHLINRAKQRNVKNIYYILSLGIISTTFLLFYMNFIMSDICLDFRMYILLNLLRRGSVVTMNISFSFQGIVVWIVFGFEVKLKLN